MSFGRILTRVTVSTSRRHLSDDAAKSVKSSHGRFYSETVPAMIPVALLGSAVYMGLHLTQSHLSHEQYMDHAKVRVAELEAQVEALEEERTNSRSHVSPGSPSKPSRWSWIGFS